jgi:hypothetical protein
VSINGIAYYLLMRRPSWYDDKLHEQALGMVRIAHHEQETVDKVIFDAVSWLVASTQAAEKTLLDRLKHGRRETSLVVLGPPLLQRLVMKASDTAAQSEAAAEAMQTEERMLARFLQYLILLFLHRNSRWAAVGIGQLVYSYHGSEVAAMMVPIVKADWDERNRKRAKEKLMGFLLDRFRGLSRVAPTGGLGGHFEPALDQVRLAESLRECLEIFTPWSTPHVLEDGVDPRFHTPAALNERKRSPLDPDWTELTRIHAFIDPLCFQRLVDALGCARPIERLRLPQLAHCENDNSTVMPSGPRAGDPPAAQPPKRMACDAMQLRRQLSEQSRRSRKYSGHEFKIGVDGVRLKPFTGPDASISIPLSVDADVVAVYGADATGDVLLATHILSHSEDGVPSPSWSVINVGWRHRFSFRIKSGSLGSETMECEVKYSATLLAKCLAPWGKGLTPVAQAVLIFGALCLGGIWFVNMLLLSPSRTNERNLRRALAEDAVLKKRLEEELVAERDKREQLQASLDNIQEPRYAPVLSPLSSVRRGLKATEPVAGDNGVNLLHIPDQQLTVTLKLPVADLSFESYRVVLQDAANAKELLMEGDLSAERLGKVWLVPWTVLTKYFKPNRDLFIKLEGTRGPDHETLALFSVIAAGS